MTSALYVGEVMHHRLGPQQHRFVYRVFSLWLDLSELPGLNRRLRLFSHNRFNLFGFHDRDHGPRDGGPLRPWLDARLAEAGIDLDGGPVHLLCFPRIFGYVFNPLAIWFCRHRDGRLRAILYEVSNTFGQHHCYLVPVTAEQSAAPVLRQSCDKGFYVSPFLPLDGRYEFRMRQPGRDLSVAIRHDGSEGARLVAVQRGQRRPLADATLLRLFVTRPLMTFKVIAGIHWEALRLVLKGARFHRRPPPPDSAVTLVPTPERAAASLAAE